MKERDFTRKNPALVHTKKELDAKVAELTGRSAREIGAITSAFLHEATRVLAEEGCILLDGLGELRVVPRTYPSSQSFGPTVVGETQKRYVSFRKARALRRAIQRRFEVPAKGDDHGKVRRERGSG